jgi:2,3-dihydroxyphenylpropionate 1,2-dioxygenase
MRCADRIIVALVQPAGAAAGTPLPSIKPELVQLTVALHGLAHDEASRVAFVADAPGYADRFRLTAEQRAALIALDTRAIVAMGAHPRVPFLASMQVERQRRG